MQRTSRCSASSKTRAMARPVGSAHQATNAIAKVWRSTGSTSLHAQLITRHTRGTVAWRLCLSSAKKPRRQNAMLVDSTFNWPDQVVRDAVRSGFRSAGQRCSALRVLFPYKKTLPIELFRWSKALIERTVCRLCRNLHSKQMWVQLSIKKGSKPCC